MKIVIIGAGLTGLILADRLHSSNFEARELSIKIFEKSRSVGGRMATRRTETAKFDHGAQFYALRDGLQDEHRRWVSKQLTRLWFERDGTELFSAPEGITSLAKDLATGLDLGFNERLISLAKTADSRWSLKFDSSLNVEADQVILTAPLPQVLEILNRSNLAYEPSLKAITYSKAVVALIELKRPSEKLAGERGYREEGDTAVFSIADQMKKGLSKAPSVTMTLSEHLSETLFDAPDADSVEAVKNEINRIDPSAEISTVQIKKWRYNRPQKTYGSLFAQVAPSLYLAGDAFGGASLNGAARSAKALALHLLDLDRA